MTTLGGIVGSQPRGGVVVYSPTRNAPTARAVSRPAPKPTKKGEQRDVESLVDPRFLATPEQQAQREQVKAQKKAADKPWWQDVLGVAGDVLSPLSVPAKLVNVGLEEGVKLLPDSWEKWMYKPFGDNDTLNSLAPILGGGIFGMDPAKTHDDQGVLERLAPRSTYGAGEIYGNDINIPGLTGLRNLGLDVLHDPLTWLTAGAGKGVELGAQAAKEVSAARTALEAAPKFLDEAGDVVNPAIKDLEAALAKAEKTASKVGNKVKIKDIPHSRQGRMGMISELAGSGPEGEAVVKQFGSEFSKGIDQGFTQMSQEAKDALGITKSGLRVRGTGKVIPGTEKLAEAMNLPGRAARIGFGKLGDTLSESSLKSLQKLGSGRTPLGLETAYKTVRSKSAPIESKLKALNEIHWETVAHTTENIVDGGAKTAANRWAKDIRKADPAELLTESQLNPDNITPLNSAIQDIAQVFADATGRDISEVAVRDARTHVPNLFTDEWGDFYRNHMTPEQQADYNALQGFTTRDTLQTSGHLDGKRVLVPGPNGEEKSYKIGDRMVKIAGEDTIENKNRAFAEAFPEFKGKVYEDDPLKIVQGYIKAVSKSARKWSLNNLADTGTSYVTSMTGALDAERQRIDEALAAQSREARVAQAANEPRVPGQRAPAVPEQPIVPGSPRDQLNRAFNEQLPELQSRAVTPDQQEQLAMLAENYPPQDTPAPSGLFRKVENTNAQQRLADQLLTPEAQAVESGLRTEAVETAERSQQMLLSARENMFEGVRKAGRSIQGKLERITERIKTYRDDLSRLKGARSNNPEAIGDVLTKVRKDIADAEAELAKRKAVWKGLGTKAANKAERAVKQHLEDLKAIRDETLAHLDENTSARVAAEVRKRTDDLFAPLKNAQERLAAKTAEYVGPYTQEQLDNAASVLEKAGVSDEHWQAYDQALAARRAADRNAALSGRLFPSVQQQRALDLEAARISGERSPYIMAQGQAAALEAAIENAPPSVARRMKAELRELNSKFSQGGEFYAERKARGVMGRQLEHEQLVQQGTQRERSLVETMRDRVLNKPEATVTNKAGEVVGDAAGLEPGGTRRITPAKLGAPEGARTEREAISAVAAQAAPDSELHHRVIDQTTQAVADLEANLPQVIGEARDAALKQIGKGADATLGPMSNNVKTMENFVTDLGNKQQLLERRKVNDALIKRLTAADISKGDLPAELLKKARELQLIARANPNLDDLTYAGIESLLHNELEQLALAAEKLSFSSELAAAQASARAGTLPKVFVAQLHDGWVTLHGGLARTGDTLVDRELYERFMRVTEAVNDPKLFTRTFNNLTNLWKTYATLSPGFHVRNALGGIFMNLSDGVGFKHQLEAIDVFKQLRAGGQDWLAEQPERIQQAVKAMYASGAGGQFEEAGMRSGLANNAISRLSRKGGTWVEGPLRLGMALHSYDQGDTLLQTYQRINRIHFDYSAVSKMDESMKRLVPFWTFMSRNLPMQITQIATKPRLYSYYGHFKNNFSVPNDPLTPDYWGRLGAWNTGKMFKGMPLYLDPDFGFNRVESDIGGVVEAVAGGNPGALLTNVNPLISAPLDFLMKRDSFYDRSFKDTDFSKQEGLVNLPLNILAQIIPGQMNEEGQVSDNFANLMSSLIPIYDRGTRLTGNKDPQRTPESWARFFGAPVRTLSDKQKQSAALGKYLDAQNEVKRRRAMAREAVG